jgi:hypothetical protein
MWEEPNFGEGVSVGVKASDISNLFFASSERERECES